MEFAAAGAAIIGLINGFRLAMQPDKTGFYFFLLAVATGLIFGYLHWFGLPGLEAGLTVALASSGVYRIGEKVSGK